MSQRYHYFFILFVVIIGLISIQYIVPQNTVVHIYCFSQSLSEELKYLYNDSELVVKVYDLNVSRNSETFVAIVNRLASLRFQILPPELCNECLIPHFNQEEIYKMYCSPLIGVFIGGRLLGIASHVTDLHTINQSILSNRDHALLVTPFGTGEIDHDLRTELEALF